MTATPTPRRGMTPLKWAAVAVLAPLALLLLLVLALALSGANWARGPLQDMALEKTGRVLQIGGDLDVSWQWPAPRLRAQGVSFANPAWAATPQMLVAEAVEVSVDLPGLLRGRLAFPEVLLTKPRVALEQAAGRKTWLLDLEQTDEGARIEIGHVLLDQGELSYTDVAARTDVLARLSTASLGTAGPAPGAAAGIVFSASGRFRGQALAAEGRGGAVLALRDEAVPYPLQVQGTVGRTRVQAEGTVTSLIKFTAVDLRLDLRGDSLASLYPLAGIALPPTPAYRSAGRLLRNGALWKYEQFTGRIGQSDIAGTLQVRTDRPRPLLSGALVSRRLDLADLGPAVGARTAAAPATAVAPPAAGRVLPDLPFDTARWASLDADVTLQASSLLREDALPLEKLQFRLRLDDRQLTLDPLTFDLAGGKLSGQVTLDGRAQPLRGKATVQVRGVVLGRLLPQADTQRARIGLLNGDIQLAGTGASVGRLLATADGRVSLVAQNGEISRLLMEQVGLHLLEILQLKLTGDQTVKLHCAVADFEIERGVMRSRALLLDTAVNTLVGSGSIDLGKETLDLTLVPRTKVASVVALRSPIHVTGSFGKPVAALDGGQVAARAAGALALGLLNPLLALLPLFEPGPGIESECKRWVSEARTEVPKAVR